MRDILRELETQDVSGQRTLHAEKTMYAVYSQQRGTTHAETAQEFTLGFVISQIAGSAGQQQALGLTVTAIDACLDAGGVEYGPVQPAAFGAGVTVQAVFVAATAVLPAVFWPHDQEVGHHWHLSHDSLDGGLKLGHGLEQCCLIRMIPKAHAAVGIAMQHPGHQALLYHIKLWDV